MKTIIRISLLLLLIPTSASAFDYCASPSRAVHQSILKVVGEGASGSGVVIQADEVVTAAHVLAGLDQIKVQVNGEWRKATLISKDEASDLALLSVDTENITPLALRREPLSKNEEVWALGFAYGKTMSSGRGQFKKDYQNLLYTSAPVDYGQSGGGLIACEDGRHVLAGVIRAFGAQIKNGKLVRRDDISVAAKPQSIRRFLASSNQLAFAHQ